MTLVDGRMSSVARNHRWLRWGSPASDAEWGQKCQREGCNLRVRFRRGTGRKANVGGAAEESRDGAAWTWCLGGKPSECRGRSRT